MLICVLATPLSPSVLGGAFAAVASSAPHRNVPSSGSVTRAISLLQTGLNIENVSAEDELIAYVAYELERDTANDPEQRDRERIRFAKGDPVRRTFNSPLATGHLRRNDINSATEFSSSDVSILPLSTDSVVLRFLAYKLTTNNVITCDLIARATIDSSGMMRGRSINYDIDEIEIDGKVGRGGRSLKVRVHAGPDLIYPGCGIGLRLDGTYVGD